LSLRHNAIREIGSSLSSLTTLTSLDLYENKLTDISTLSNTLPNLTYLDVSFNELRVIDPPLEGFPVLREL